MLGFDRNDQGELQDFVMWLRNVILWLCFIIISLVVIATIFKAGNGGLPPEPQWWLELENIVGW